jgi:hypothetical protein
MATLELLSLLLRKPLYLLLQQDIVLRFIRIDSPQLHLIPPLTQNPRNQNISRHDSRSTKNRPFRKLLLLALDQKLSIPIVTYFSSRAPNLNFLSNRHAIQDINHRSTGLVFIREVRLGDEAKRPVFFFFGDGTSRCVAAVQHLVFKVEAILDVSACFADRLGLQTSCSDEDTASQGDQARMPILRRKIVWTPFPVLEMV